MRRLASHLAVVPVGSIFVHEFADPSRTAPLRAALVRQGVVHTPVLVGILRGGGPGGKPFVHLDGANRLSALSQLGCDKVPVQILDLDDPSQVRLGTWAHETRADREELLARVEALEGVLIRRGDGQPPALFPTGIQTVLAFADAWYELGGSSDPATRLRVFRAIVGCYRASVLRHPTPERGGPTAPTLATNDGVLVRFGPISRLDFAHWADRGETLPPGITRFDVPSGRIVGLRMPLSMLRPEVEPASASARLSEATRRPPQVVHPPVTVEDYLGARVYDDPLLCYDRAYVSLASG